MEFGLESLSFSPACSLRKIGLQGTAPFIVGVRNLPQRYAFKDQSHSLFYQSPQCRLADKLAKKGMQGLVEIVKDNQNLEPPATSTLAIEQKLLQELASLKLQLKEKKRQVKEEKKALKNRKQTKVKKLSSSSSSSSSSESSNSDADNYNTVDMRMMKERRLEQVDEVVSNVSTDAKPCYNSEGKVEVERIEVCLGGNCRKAGSKGLLAALQERIPCNTEVCAVGCKCMGRCGTSINVKVSKEDANPQYHNHVKMEDAELLLRHHFGIREPVTELPRFRFPTKNQVPALAC